MFLPWIRVMFQEFSVLSALAFSHEYGHVVGFGEVLLR